MKYPTVTVQLTGRDGNAYSILGTCLRAMRKADLPQSELDAFRSEATAGDYDNLLATACRWFDVA